MCSGFCNVSVSTAEHYLSRVEIDAQNLISRQAFLPARNSRFGLQGWAAVVRKRLETEEVARLDETADERDPLGIRGKLWKTE